jgi:metal-responsive CopG/Arc/MetJ family transcriptional regulator
MAKVMVSFPDDLLERIDVQARARHESRSGFLRELAERELAARASQERSGIQALLGDPVRLGGDSVKLIRHDRRSR